MSMNMVMGKCNFCDKSGPDGKCSWSIQAARESDCRKAIERMQKAFNNSDEHKKKKHHW